MTTQEIMAALAAPFDAADLRFKPQAVSKDQTKAMAVPYISARAVMDRLDAVVGADCWQDSYAFLADGNVHCSLTLRFGERQVTKEDVGGPSDQPDQGDRLKAAVSDALKRAAVKFGVGRYLYRARPQWVPYDAQRRQFTQQPALPAGPPEARHGPPAAKNGAAATAPPATRAKVEAPRANNRPDALRERAKVFEGLLVARGLCMPGELVDDIHDALCNRFRASLEIWPEESMPEVERRCKEFAEARRKPMSADTASAIIAELHRTGVTWADMLQRLNWGASQVAELAAGQGAVVLSHLSEIADKERVK